MTTDIQPVMEIALQEAPIFGWVVLAKWPTGEVEQLVGVYSTLEAAESWLGERYHDWLEQAITVQRRSSWGRSALVR